MPLLIRVASMKNHLQFQSLSSPKLSLYHGGFTDCHLQTVAFFPMDVQSQYCCSSGTCPSWRKHTKARSSHTCCIHAALPWLFSFYAMDRSCPWLLGKQKDQERSYFLGHLPRIWGLHSWGLLMVDMGHWLDYKKVERKTGY